jgi:hypothetical protein
MEVLINKPFDYAVLAQEHKRYFVVVCGTSALFDVWVEKTIAETDVTCPQSPYQLKFQKSKVCKIN